ncbi:MAG: DUF3253 domain-containing protein [Erythrobacter sp.]
MPAAPPPRGVTAGAAILALLGQRAKGTTICPSEAARLIAGPQGDWRAEMEAVHAATDALLAQGAITLSWKGETKQKRRGPYRIARR